MDFSLDEEQRRWRDEVRAFLAAQITPELRAELHEHGVRSRGPEATKFKAAVRAKGWYGLTWPVEFGGLGRSVIEQHVMMYEFDYAHVPGPGTDLAVTSVAPIIMRHGTDQNKRDWIPGIAAGDITVAVGYSEPDAGTDLASLQTRAVLDHGEWVINGAKIWNSHAQMCTHEWLCVRTDPTAPKHKGISVIMVPIDSPGIDVQPIYTWGDMQTNQTFFVDVRVPKDHLIGEVNQGWSYITGALDLERGALTHSGELRGELDRLMEYCRATGPDGTRPADDPLVRHRLAELDADVEVARLLGLEAASLIDQGEIPSVTVSVEKVFSSDLRQRIADYGMQILGMAGQLDAHDPGAPLDGAMERLYRYAPLMKFGGGTNEILRDVIAQRGHGMPTYGRTRRPERTSA